MKERKKEERKKEKKKRERKENQLKIFKLLKLRIHKIYERKRFLESMIYFHHYTIRMIEGTSGLFLDFV